MVVRAKVEDESVAFSVSDTGPGISEHQLPHIFDRYWRAEQRSRLGLAISKGIIEAHGGTIRVESEIDRGSTFTFTLPLAA